MIDTMAWACQWGVADSYVYLAKPIACLRTYAARLAHLLPSVGWVN